jgi:ribosomal protein S18 acetylase RimI-like enzyme
MADVRYEKLSGQQASGMIADLVDLYTVVYADPPYEEGPEQVRRFAEALPAQLNKPGFELTRAVDGRGLIGAAYGWTMAAGRWFSRAVQDPPLEIKDAAKLAVMEWIVHPAYRRQGIGDRLIRLLLADRTEPWAVLSSDPRSDARGMYERAGWQQCGRSVLPWGPPMDLLALPLPLR